MMGKRICHPLVGENVKLRHPIGIVQQINFMYCSIVIRRLGLSFAYLVEMQTSVLLVYEADHIAQTRTHAEADTCEHVAGVQSSVVRLVYTLLQCESGHVY